MKRYWTSVVAVLLALSGIIVYYSIGTRNHLPEYKLETVQGNPVYGKAVNLSGSYFGNMRSEQLSVSMRGSVYRESNFTFRHYLADSGSWFYSQSGIKALVDKYSSFMRGKMNFDGFFRDKERVIYAEAERVGGRSEEAGVRISLDILDEKSGKESRIENTYPLKTAFDYLYLVDVQLVEDQVFLLVQQLYYEKPPGGKELFVIDINNGNLLRNELIHGPERGGNGGQTEISIIKPLIFSDTSQHIILDERTSSDVIDGHRNSVEKAASAAVDDEVPSKLYSFSYVTGEVVALPDHYSLAKKSGQRAYSLQNDMFYWAESDPASISLSRYDLALKKDDFDYTTITAEAIGGGVIKSVQISKDRVYVLLMKEERAMAAVLDLKDGMLLYSGKPAVVDDNSRSAEKLSAIRLLNLDVHERYNE
ncbi:hypothetical protein KP806_04435 [Paenibacillus sp. N4]|uniref:hypothetical protein n=1 Tax=Paenibacillus vietnamensis TaxID=2590547 RepID=UPI001CD136D6|nr:hypothetical protein [Paenibacillus vietnamensis]MCA0754284.1 hypothetical protein [Paenibacillus vietnamensis]